MSTSHTFSDQVRYPKLNTYKGLYGKIPIRYPDIYIGVEIEAENISRSLQSYPGSFKAVDDGSLKMLGKEFVTVPIKLKYLEQELDRLFKAIPTAVFSSRTSIHIHMNARDFTVDNLLTFLLLYTIFERPLYRFSGDRWGNNFCIPLRHSPYRLLGLLEYCSLRMDNLNYLFGDGIQWDKYLGLNIGPLMGIRDSSSRYGTIEFRHMKGNNDVGKIINWCNLITCLKFFSKTATLSQIIEYIKKGDISYTQDIFKEWTPLIISNSTEKEIKDGNSYAKYILHRSNFLLDKKIANKDPIILLDEELNGSIRVIPPNPPRAPRIGDALRSSSYPRISMPIPPLDSIGDEELRRAISEYSRTFTGQ